MEETFQLTQCEEDVRPIHEEDLDFDFTSLFANNSTGEVLKSAIADNTVIYNLFSIRIDSNAA